MGFLRLLAAGRTAVLDGFFSGLTYFGSELAFMAAALLIFWCVDKRQGYYVFLVGAFGTICNQFLKLAFRIPRPWVLDPEFQIVEAARADATGYSFPSGHVTAAAAGMTALCLMRGRKLVVPSVIVVLLMAISRNYLMAHYPSDVLFAAIIGVASAFIAYYITRLIFRLLEDHSNITKTCLSQIHRQQVQEYRYMRVRAEFRPSGTAARRI